MSESVSLYIPPDSPSRNQWDIIGTRHHHGIALPLLALRNPQGSAVGEFLDLIPIIDWCKEIGFDVIQLLPINDSEGDSSPYSAISALALHPLYLTLKDLPHLQEHPELISLLEPLKTCNSSQRVAYNAVRRNKEKFLRLYFDAVFPKMKQTADYLHFIDVHPWVSDFALFKTLKEAHELKPWWEWEDEYRNPTAEQIPKFKSIHAREIEFHTFIQYLCFTQFSEVKKHAEKKKVFLKGDIPILLNRDSADVWLYRDFFLLEYSAGAPPDMYSEEGQYWGFPLYDWKEVRAQNYSWWKIRLYVAQALYHIFRVDHVVGLFRIWAIPGGKKPKEGFYIPHETQNWLHQGEEALRMMLASSTMLPIGEDLGVVPDKVRACLTHLGIPGTKVMRWERRWHEDRSFIPPIEYNPLSMTTVSTHDSETLAQWWRAQREDVQTFAKQMHWPLTHEFGKDKRLNLLHQSHTSSSLFHINLLQEYLALFDELVWDNIDDERINVPGTVSDRNWTYRFKPTIDQIVQHEGLKKAMKELIR